MENFTEILSFFTLLAHLGLLITLLSYLFWKNKCSWFFDKVAQNGAILAFLIALASMLGSLYYSDVIGLEPCLMCWYQRIFMYSLVFIFGLAMFKKSWKEIIPYSLLLSYVGAALALFHTYLQFGQNKQLVTCSINSNVSCADTYFVMFGYISIPVISLTAFLMIIAVLLITNKYAR